MGLDLLFFGHLGLFLYELRYVSPPMLVFSTNSVLGPRGPPFLLLGVGLSVKPNSKVGSLT